MKSKLAAALALLLAGTASATTMLRMEVRELTAQADVVVRARVTELTSRWTPDGRRIVTDVTLEVAEAYKGVPAKTLTIVQPGGVVGDIGQTVHGMPQFEKDSEVVAFLEKRGDKVFAVVGMAQGVLRVERSSDGKAVFAVPEPVEATVLDPVTREPISPRTQPMPLETLKATVRESNQAVP